MDIDYYTLKIKTYLDKVSFDVEINNFVRKFDTLIPALCFLSQKLLNKDNDNFFVSNITIINDNIEFDFCTHENITYHCKLLKYREESDFDCNIYSNVITYWNFSAKKTVEPKVKADIKYVKFDEKGKVKECKDCKYYTKIDFCKFLNMKIKN